MPTPVKFYSFTEALAEGLHNLGSDTLKVALSNIVPDETTDTDFTDITEILAGNGYTAGGEAITVTGSVQTGGVYRLEANDITWTATLLGSIAEFRYAVLYNSSSGDRLIQYWDVGTTNLTDPETFTLGIGNGVLWVV